MDPGLDSDRLLAIIATQDEIVAAGLDLDAVMALVAERARALTGAESAVVEMVDGSDLVYRAGAGAAAPFLGLRLAIDSSLSGACVRAGEVLSCRDAETDPRVDREAARKVGAISMVCVPLRHAGGIAGVLKVYDPEPDAFGAADIETLGLLSNVIGAHMAHASEYEAQHEQSRHDALTGLPNRRAFDERIGIEVARSLRGRTPLSLCLLDLDDFKEINDSLGHAAGDRVLQAVARTFTAIRGGDLAFRIGGDEFALILPDSGIMGAELVASRVGRAVRADADCLGVGISWGSAQLRQGDVAALVSQADTALYAAKRMRSNRG